VDQSSSIRNEKQIEAVIDFLKQVEMLHPVAMQTIAGIALVLKEEALPEGKTLFRKGDIGRCMYMIVEGQVKVHDGDHVFDTLGPTQAFGEYALLDAEARSASITAISDTRLLRFDQDDFYWLMGNVEVAKGMMAVFTKRLRRHNELEEALMRLNAQIKAQHEQILRENALIERQKEEIIAQHEEILAQQSEIEKQNEMLLHWNKKMGDSIRYAQRIQAAMLPGQEEFRQQVGQCFLLYRPRDVVSGDFYWAGKLGTRRLVAVGDCTGHGVPGALMTMAGVMLLEQLVAQQPDCQVHELLAALNRGMIHFLDQHKSGSVSDGMDLGLCAIDEARGELSFAGARIPLVVIRDGEMQVFKGDKESVGGVGKLGRTYTRHVLPLQGQAMHYLFSDGYQDQFDERGRKLMRKRFRSLLQELHALPLAEQERELAAHIDQWKGQSEQTDDILVVGFRG
jgi:serine phosphatase RsbU (regulator of sigma subunit)